MAEYKNINCPSCGAPGEVDRFAAMAVCAYCRGAFYLKDEAVLAMGEMAILAETDSPLYLNATGKLRGKRFTIMGHIQYRYSEGLWEEWFLRCDDGSELWINEDEMEYSLEEEVQSPGVIPPVEQIEPGQAITIAGKNVSVDEIDQAELVAAEGSLPFQLGLDRTFPYFDASGEDAVFTVEYVEDGIEVYAGTWLDAEEIKLEAPKPDSDRLGWS